MVINNFDIVRVAFVPSEANPPLVIDSDAPLSFPITMQPLEPVARRNSKVLDLRCSIEHPKLSKRHSLDIERQLSRSLQVE